MDEPRASVPFGLLQLSLFPFHVGVWAQTCPCTGQMLDRRRLPPLRCRYPEGGVESEEAKLVGVDIQILGLFQITYYLVISI